MVEVVPGVGSPVEVVGVEEDGIAGGAGLREGRDSGAVPELLERFTVGKGLSRHCQGERRRGARRVGGAGARLGAERPLGWAPGHRPSPRSAAAAGGDRGRQDALGRPTASGAGSGE